MSYLRSSAAVVVTLVLLSGTCWQAIGELLFLWPPGFGAVHSLHVRSPVSGTVCVLAQSTIVALLSLPWLGLLLVFVRFLCLRLTLCASACVGPHGYRPSPGSVLLLQPGFLFSGLVVWGSFHPVPSPHVFLRDVVTLSGH